MSDRFQDEKIGFNDLNAWLKIAVIIAYIMGVLWVISFTIGFIIGFSGAL